MKLKMILAVCAAVFAVSAIAQNPLAQIKGLAKEAAKVKYTNKKTIKDGNENTPPMRRDSYIFTSNAGQQVISYSRALNVPPYFKGKAQSLTWERGIGFATKHFSHWYGNNCIRVYINNKDVMAQTPAKVTHFESEHGKLVFTWDLGSKRTLTLDFRVMPENDRIYCKINMNLPGMEVSDIRVNLRCYPGGFGPAYKQPSDRYGVAEFDVKGAMAKDGNRQTFDLNPKGKWVFLADKIPNKGAVAAIFDPVGEEDGIAKMNVSYYESSISLTYSPFVRNINIGFYAFPQQNDAALKSFQTRVEKDYKEITSMK